MSTPEVSEIRRGWDVASSTAKEERRYEGEREKGTSDAGSPNKLICQTRTVFLAVGLNIGTKVSQSACSLVPHFRLQCHNIFQTNSAQFVSVCICHNGKRNVCHMCTRNLISCKETQIYIYRAEIEYSELNTSTRISSGPATTLNRQSDERHRPKLPLPHRFLRRYRTTLRECTSTLTAAAHPPNTTERVD